MNNRTVFSKPQDVFFTTRRSDFSFQKNPSPLWSRRSPPPSSACGGCSCGGRPSSALPSALPRRCRCYCCQDSPRSEQSCRATQTWNLLVKLWTLTDRRLSFFFSHGFCVDGCALTVCPAPGPSLGRRKAPPCWAMLLHEREDRSFLKKDKKRMRGKYKVSNKVSLVASSKSIYFDNGHFVGCYPAHQGGLIIRQR